MSTFAARVNHYSPDEPRDEQGRWTDGGGSAQAGRDVSTASLREASRLANDRISSLEAQGLDSPENPEFAALAHIDSALDAAFSTPMSQAQYVRTAFVFDSHGRAVAGGLMTFKRGGDRATIENLGSLVPHGGSRVVASLVTQARERFGVTYIRALPENAHARGFLAKQGFKGVGNGNWVERPIR